MDQKLKETLERIVHKVSLAYRCKNDSIEQIDNYANKKDPISLLEFVDKGFTIACHQSYHYGHILMVNKTIAEIKLNAVKTIPDVVFAINIGKGFARLQPGRMDRVIFSDMGKDFFEVFLKIQRVIYDSL